MRMRKVVFVFTLLLQIPLLAQNLSEAEVSAIMTQSFQLNKEGKHKEALEGFLKVGQNTKGQRNESERQVYVCSQTMAVMCYESLVRYEEGFRLSEELLSGNVNEREQKDLQHLYVMNGYFLATSYMQKNQRQYAEARTLFEEILPFAEEDMRQRILPKLPLSWYFEGAQLQLEQKYGEALNCMLKARDGFQEIGDTKNEVEVWCQIGTIKNFMYDLMGAVDAYHSALLLAASTKYDTKLMEIFREQYKLSEELGDSEKLFSISQKMDSLAASTDDQKIKFTYYNHLGDKAKGQGNYKLAEQWYRKNDGYISQLAYDYRGADKFLHYANLRNLFAKAGNLDDALEYAKKSKSAFQRTTNESDKNYYMPYMAIADVYRLKGDSVRCFQALDTLFFSLPRMDEPREAQQLYVLRASCRATFKDYENALKDYRTIDELLATKYGEDDGDRVRLLPLMGGIEHKLKQYNKSEVLYKKYADRIKTLYGETHTDYINALGYLANAEGFAGHIELACSDYTSSVNKLKEQIRLRLPYLNTAEREGYWKQVSELIQNMTPFALEAKEYQTPFTEACYDGLVLSKAFLLGTERSTYDIIKRYGTEEDKRVFSQIASMQAKLREWENEGLSRTDSILALTSKVRQMESHLSERCRSYGDMTTFMRIGYKEIKDKLKDGDMLIDFTDYLSESRGRVYAAYLVNNKQENPLLMKLFAESKIDSMGVKYPERYYEKPYAETMLNLLWEPFKEKVAEGATVYYVPSQLLFQIALESIPMEDGSLLGEHYHFVRLSSARELVNLNQKFNTDMAARNPNAVLYGGLLYDLEANDWEAEAKKYDVSSLLAVRGDIVRGDSVFRILPGSKKEVDAIGQILKSHRLIVESFTGKRGTEESFLSMSGKAPEILHVATHGFYYTPDEAQKVDYLRGYKDAMSLSGLVMSGGNAAWRGRELPNGVLGGILTASNIARLDLSHTELVVLSACESGKGKATAEGLYGLQRAFKKAGVKTMVMSLWNVSDVVGTEFMNMFYENLFDKDNHQDKRKAFEKAKMAIRKKYPKPYYWACFVMMD